MKKILSLLFGVLLLAGPVYAQGPDASGTWDLNVNTPNGPIAAVLTLKREGEKLSGTIVGPPGEAALQGSQKDKAIAINFSMQTSNGPLPIAMSGAQEGDVISGTVDFGQGQSDWTGKRRAAAGAASGAASAPVATAAAPSAQDKPADVDGAWQLAIDLGGNAATPGLTLKQDGEKLTGVYSSQLLGEQQVTGTIKGNDITFGFQASFDGNAVKVTYTGTVDKDTMKGKVVFGDLGEGTFTGKKK
jgi:hypothetical protein